MCEIPQKEQKQQKQKKTASIYNAHMVFETELMMIFIFFFIQN